MSIPGFPVSDTVENTLHAQRPSTGRAITSGYYACDLQTLVENDDLVIDNYEDLLPSTPLVYRNVLNCIAKGVHLRCKLIEKRSRRLLSPRIFELRSESGNVILSAVELMKSRTSYISVMHEGVAIGKLRSDFIGSQYVFSCLSGAELISIQYESKLRKSKTRKGPRNLRVAIPSIELSASDLDPGELRCAMKSNLMEANGVDLFRNRQPSWSGTVGGYVLYFPTRRKLIESVKNFVLETSKGKAIVQFGRLDRSTFAIDFTYPFNPLQAFALALSALDFKLCCE
jgi:hypothetical protein